MEEKKNLESKNSNKKITLFIILAVLVTALIVLAVINSSKNKGINTGDIANGTDKTANTQTDNSVNAPVTGEVTPSNLLNPSTPTSSEVSGEASELSETAGETEIKKEAPIEKTNPITVDVTIDSEKGFSPASIDVKAGQQVTLNITSNGGVAIVVFDGGLSASAIGISNGQTKDVTFTAPVTRGAYSFHNDIPGKSQTCKINVK